MAEEIIKNIKEWGLENIPGKIYDAIPSIIAFLLTIIIGFWISNKIGKLLVRILDKRGVDTSIHRFLQRSISILLKIVVAVMALEQIGFNVNSFITALGAAGITAGLGLQNSIAQLAGGIQILFNKPFKSGDYIKIDDYEGKVKEIRFMYTTLVTNDNKEVIVPNQNITTKNFINFTANEKIRMNLVFSIGYKDDIEKAKEVLLNVATSNRNVVKEPKPVVGVLSHGESSINIALYAWCISSNYWPSYFSLQEEVKLAFDKNGINIPYNQLDVHIIGE